MRSERIDAAISALVHHAREEGIAYESGGCVRDIDAEKRTESARAELRAALAEAEAPQGGWGAVACADCTAGHPRYFVPTNGETIHALPGGTISPCVKANPQPAAERAVVEARVPLGTLETWLARLNREEFSGIGHIRSAMEDAIAAAKPAQEPPRAKPAEGGEGGA